ncbi:hypothetical protein D9M68_608910 [compost metagenome]
MQLRHAPLQIARLAGLADHCGDLHQVDITFQVTPQGQSFTEQVEALQGGLGTDELAIGVTHQVEVGDQHGQEEQDTDQAELHAEAEAVH